MDLSCDDQLRLYRTMVLARALAEQMSSAPGARPSKCGGEALAVGAAMALAAGDIIAPQRHDLGAYLIGGLSPEDLLSGGWVAGDMRARLIAPRSQDAGKGLAVAAGMALGTQLRGEQRATLAYIQSVEAESADSYEAFRFAASHRLPLVCLVKCPFTEADDDLALPGFSGRLAAFGVSPTRVDGGDALAVYAATSAAIDAARSGAGPVALIAPYIQTTAQGSYPDDDFAAGDASQHDPIARLAAMLIADGTLTAEDCKQITGDVAEHVASAVVISEQSASPLTTLDDATLFASSDVAPLGPPPVSARVAVPVTSESRGYR